MAEERETDENWGSPNAVLTAVLKQKMKVIYSRRYCSLVQFRQAGRFREYSPREAQHITRACRSALTLQCTLVVPKQTSVARWLTEKARITKNQLGSEIWKTSQESQRNSKLSATEVVSAHCTPLSQTFPCLLI